VNSKIGASGIPNCAGQQEICGSAPLLYQAPGSLMWRRIVRPFTSELQYRGIPVGSIGKNASNDEGEGDGEAKR
jgi:hypothetical protein